MPGEAGLSEGVSFDCKEYPVPAVLCELNTGQVCGEEMSSLDSRVPQSGKHRECERFTNNRYIFQPLGNLLKKRKEKHGGIY